MGAARGVATAYVLTALLGSSGVVEAQRLFTYREPHPSATKVASPTTTPIDFVRIDLDLVRSGPARLDLTTPRGRTLEINRAEFEDRGEGNVLWTGRFADTDYENVQLTLHDGHLLGWYQSPGRDLWDVFARQDGLGRVLKTSPLPTGFRDLVHDRPSPLTEPSLLNAATPNGDPTQFTAVNSTNRLPVPSRADGTIELDILALYTKRVAAAWATTGGVDAHVQAAFDYLNLVFRNSNIPARARLVGLAPASAEVELGILFSAFVFYNPFIYNKGILDYLAEDSETIRLRRQYKADLVHLFGHRGNIANRLNGQDDWAMKTAYSGFSTSDHSVTIRHPLNPRRTVVPNVMYGKNFTSSVGHNLGAGHNIERYSDPEYSRAVAVRPYAFGYSYWEQGSGDVGWMDEGTDRWIHTIMDRGLNGIGNPFFSSARNRPNGWTIGVAGESENDRAISETIPHVAAASHVLPRPLLPPSHLQGAVLDDDRFGLTWRDNSENEDGFIISYELDGSPLGRRQVGPNATAVQVPGLPAGRISFYVSAYQDDRTAAGDPLHVALPASPGVPVPPSGLALTPVWGASRGPIARLATAHWRDNSADETEFRLWWSEAGHPEEPVDVGADQYHVTLTLRPGARTYRLRIEARNERGSSSSRQSSVLRIVKPLLTAKSLGGGRLRLSWEGTPGNVKHYVLWSTLNRFSLVGCPASPLANDPRSFFTRETSVEVPNLLPGCPYNFFVTAYRDGRPFGLEGDYELNSNLVTIRIPDPQPGKATECSAGEALTFPSGIRVSMCWESSKGAQDNALDYGLDAAESALLYFFERDNAEVLVKVLNGCEINGHHWVFVAPVTDLAFNLEIHDPETDLLWRHRNRHGMTARTRSDTTAFPCASSDATAALAASSFGAPLPDSGSPSRIALGQTTDCEPAGAAIELTGGHRVSMCYEKPDGAIGNALDFGLDSGQSALLYFFERNNAEVLLKVLDGCELNGHHWVFVAPVTDLAFNLHIDSPDGERWTHRNRGGFTAEARSDVRAFACS